MALAVWTVLALAALVGMFAACVIVVAAGIRVLEGVLAKRREKAAPV
jgi:hypothetical protein